jgi:hypothetical protein
MQSVQASVTLSVMSGGDAVTLFVVSSDAGQVTVR